MWRDGKRHGRALAGRTQRRAAALKVIRTTRYYHIAYPALADLRRAEESQDPEKRLEYAESAEAHIRSGS